MALLEDVADFAENFYHGFLVLKHCPLVLRHRLLDLREFSVPPGSRAMLPELNEGSRCETDYLGHAGLLRPIIFTLPNLFAVVQFFSPERVNTFG
jgi:hypothetical protein